MHISVGIKMNYYTLFTFLATLLAVSPSPLADECTVTSYDNVEAAAKACSTLIIDGITVPAGKSLAIKLLDGASLTFKRTIKFEYHEWAGPLVTIQGKKVSVNGYGSTFDGQGALYWDGKGSGGKKKPKFMRIKTTGGSKLEHIHILNCPVHCVSINSASDTVLSDFNIDVSAGDANGGHNTDGFDVSSCTGITVQNSVIKNQDDCVAINQGSNFVFHNLTCSGGHGLSLSVGQSSENGSPNTVSNVVFSDSTVMNSDNGIHVKTHVDAGTGAVTDVTYKNIKLSADTILTYKSLDGTQISFKNAEKTIIVNKGIRKYGINIQQDYKDGGSSGTAGNNIPIHNLALNNVQGSMTGTNGMAVYILCGSSGCASWPWSGVSVSGGHKSNSCNFTPSGFSC